MSDTLNQLIGSILFIAVITVCILNMTVFADYEIIEVEE